MSFAGEQPMEALLKQPRTAMVLLELYEGLAQSCDQLMKKAHQAPLTPADQAQLDRFRNFYAKRVGVDVTRRGTLREEADRRIQQQASCTAKK